MSSYFGFEAYDVEKNNDPFVFISYKNEDCDRVAVYARYLHDHGVNVWYDNGLHAGTDWESYLMTVIEKPSCAAVLLFVSASVAHSSVIPLETTQARASKKPTVAIYLEPGLDLGVLLNKAIKVYVEQRQSINAYAGTEENVCTQILEAVRNAGESPSAAASQPVGELWQNAQMFLRNAERSRDKEDVSRARSYLVPMTEQAPADYRGWLGLAMGECLHRVGRLDDALDHLKCGAKYYSYVVSAGADAAGTTEYTRVKSRMWRDILTSLRRSLESFSTLKELQWLEEEAQKFDKRFGHTDPDIEPSYRQLMSDIHAAIDTAKSDPVLDFQYLRLPGTSEAELTLYTGSNPYVNIPPEIDGCKITVINSKAFAGNTAITSVNIPGTVRTIEIGAFRDCTALRSVTMGEGVETIKLYAFQNCTALGSINIPESVTYIGGKAFQDCASLTSITIPTGTTYIGSKPFLGCKSLTVSGRGGYFSPMRKAARASGVPFRRIK